jgi:hypothetical protein
MSTTQSTPAVPAPGIPNLRQARKDQAKVRAASKAAHPAGKALPANKASAKAPAKSATMHCPQCGKDQRVTEENAFEGRDQARATLGCGHVVTKAPGNAEQAPRQAPTQSGRAKLKWAGDIARAGDVEIGRRVEKADGKFDAIVKINGKNTVLATGKSRDGASIGTTETRARRPRRSRPEGGGVMIAALAVAMVGMMLAILAIGYGVYRATGK